MQKVQLLNLDKLESVLDNFTHFFSFDAFILLYYLFLHAELFSCNAFTVKIVCVSVSGYLTEISDTVSYT